MIGGKNQDLATERRDRVDGGLNTRGSPNSVKESQCIRLENMDFQEEGSIATRDLAAQLIQATWAGAGLLPAPTVAILAGGGSMPAGTFDISYWMSYSNSGVTLYTSPSAVTTIAGVNANDRLQIDIPCNNLGEGAGQGSDGADDPFNGAVAGPELTAGDGALGILVKKSTDPLASTNALSTHFTWNSSARVRRGVLSAYPKTGLLSDNDAGFPLRFIMWHPGLQQMIGVTVDKAVLFAQDFSSFTRFAIANDKSGNAHYWSRICTPMFGVILDQIAVMADNIGRPKRLHWTGSASTSNWRLLGANVPASAPTTVLNVAAGNLNGAYTYKVAYVFRDGCADLTTLDIESNASAASSPAVSPANQKIDVTIPGTSETGLQFRRVYRTKGGGSVYFFHSDQAAGSSPLTFTDNTADSGLGITTPVDDVGKVPNDVPPNRLAFLMQHDQRLFAWVANYILDASGRITDFIASNVCRYTKAPQFGTSEAINAWPATFEVDCGDSTPVTGAVSQRGYIHVFKGNSIGLISNVADDEYRYDTVVPDTGAMRFSMIAIGSLIFFWEDSRGPMAYDGHTVTELGYEIYPTWKSDRKAGLRPLNVWFNPRRNEIHWMMTDWILAPDNTLTKFNIFREYVFHVPSKAWTYFFSTVDDGANSPPAGRTALSSARVVRSGVSQYPGAQVYSQVISSVRGRALLEDSENANRNNSNQILYDRGDGLCKFKYFFGDNWQMVKTPLYIAIESSIPANSIISVFIVMSNDEASGNGVQIATLTGDATRFGIRVDWIQIPTEVYPNAQGASGFLNEDRGITILLEIQNKQAAPTIIRALSVQYKDKSDQRNFP